MYDRLSEINENPFLDQLIKILSQHKEILKNSHRSETYDFLLNIQDFISNNFVQQGVFYEVIVGVESWLEKLKKLDLPMNMDTYSSICKDFLRWKELVNYGKSNYFSFNLNLEKHPTFVLPKLLNHLEEKTEKFFLKFLEYCTHYEEVTLEQKVDPQMNLIRLIGSCLINKKIQVLIESIRKDKEFIFKVSFIEYHNREWNNLTTEDIRDIIDFIDDLFLLNTERVFFNHLCELGGIFGLSELINDQIKRLLNEKKNIPRFNNLQWINSSRFSLKKFELDENQLKFGRMNIFIGKNNTGKTRALQVITEKLCSHNVDDICFKPKKIFRNAVNLSETEELRTLEAYYIPKERKLRSSSASLDDFNKNLSVLLETIKAKMCNRGNEWSLDDFPKLIKPFFISFEWKDSEFDFSEKLSHTEKEIAHKIWKLLKFITF